MGSRADLGQEEFSSSPLTWTVLLDYACCTDAMRSCRRSPWTASVDHIACVSQSLDEWLPYVP